VILDRIELADIRGPKLMARKLHEQIGTLNGPVPIEVIAEALDIVEVRISEFDGFEGMLLTDTSRREGAILANARGGPRRARFIIAHELGHYLLERHVLSDEAGFRCRAADLREGREDNRHRIQETQANQFAAEILCPTAAVTKLLSGEPDLHDGERLSDTFDVSLEAAVRRIVDVHDEPLAAIWSKDGQVRYFVSGQDLPFLTCRPKNRLPKDSAAARAVAQRNLSLTRLEDAAPYAWTDRPDIEILEQTRVGKNGHAVTLLWMTNGPDGADEDDELLPELGQGRFQ
jgi:hypothetical protein